MYSVADVNHRAAGGDFSPRGVASYPREERTLYRDRRSVGRGHAELDTEQTVPGEPVGQVLFKRPQVRLRTCVCYCRYLSPDRWIRGSPRSVLGGHVSRDRYVDPGVVTETCFLPFSFVKDMVVQDDAIDSVLPV